MIDNILNVFKKEVIHLRRDKRLVPVILAIPIIQLILLGYAANLDIRNIPFAVLDEDNTSVSRQLIESFSQSGYFDLRYHIKNYHELESLIASDKIRVALIIDRNFDKDLANQHPASLQFIVDGSDGFQAGVALNYAASIIQLFTNKIIVKRLSYNIIPIGGDVYHLIRHGKGNLVDSRIRLWYNPELKSRYFMVPGVIVIILMLLTMILTSVSVAREKELGTMEHLIVTPLSRKELIIGKLLPFIFIGFIDVALIVSVGVFWFKLPFKGSLALLALGAACFLMSTLSLGIFISIISKTQHQAMMTGFFLALPYMLLSGFVFPIENMPKWIQYITYIIPPKYFLIIVRGIFLKGVGFSILWPQFAILIIIGLILLVLSVLFFKKSL